MPDIGVQSSPEDSVSPVALANRRAWNERWGGYKSQASTLKWVCGGLLLITSITAVDNLARRAQNHAVPYVIEVNRLGDQRVVGRAAEAQPADARVIKASLQDWIERVRSVTTDVADEKDHIKRAYALMDVHGSGYQFLNSWWSAHDPFKKARDSVVTVETQNPLPEAGYVWRIEWTETETSRQGGSVTTESWQAHITIKIDPPTDDATIHANPGGIYIESIEWSKR